MKFNKFSYDLNVKLKTVFFTWKEYIGNGIGLKIMSIDPSIKNKQMPFWSELPFEIVSFNSCLDIWQMNIIFSSVERNGYKFLGTKSKN